jgi:hypothetical protein
MLAITKIARGDDADDCHAEYMASQARPIVGQFSPICLGMILG